MDAPDIPAREDRVWGRAFKGTKKPPLGRKVSSLLISALSMPVNEKNLGGFESFR